MERTPDPCAALAYYEIHVKDRLSQQSTVWFDDMAITIDESTIPPQTIIHGYVHDQAALYGLISRVRNLGLSLVSVKRVDSQEEKN
jgi:uncharacterized DUF497 family protein